MIMFFLILLIWLMLPVLSVFFYILFGCFFGFKRVFEAVNRRQRLFIFFVAWIFFLLGMACVIVPATDAISEKYGVTNKYSDSERLHNKFQDILLYMIEGFQEDTVYAPGYSAENFNKIEIGMTPEQVLELVGEPLKKSEARWDYTALRENDRCYCYWVREVYFGSDKKVSKVDAYYWWD